jgi:hypothetical protein
MTFCNKALQYRKLLNSASQNKRTTTSLRFCNDKCEAVKAQVWKSQGTTVTQELSRQHRKLSDNSNETYRPEGQAINAGKVKQPNDVRARAVDKDRELPKRSSGPRKCEGASHVGKEENGPSICGNPTTSVERLNDTLPPRSLCLSDRAPGACAVRPFNCRHPIVAFSASIRWCIRQYGYSPGSHQPPFASTSMPLKCNISLHRAASNSLPIERICVRECNADLRC